MRYTGRGRGGDELVTGRGAALESNQLSFGNILDELAEGRIPTARYYGKTVEICVVGASLLRMGHIASHPGMQPIRS